MASGLKPLRRSQAVIGKVLRLNDQVCVGVETKSELAVQLLQIIHHHVSTSLDPARKQPRSL